MSADVASGKVAVQLSWYTRDGMVTVTPKDQDRFVMRVGTAIELLAMKEKAERVRKQMNLLFRNLAEWLKDRDDVSKAYVTLRDGELAFIVVHDSSKYNEAFEDDLSDLDVSLANDIDLKDIDLSVLSLPRVSDEALDSFLHSEVQFSLNADVSYSETPSTS